MDEIDRDLSILQNYIEIKNKKNLYDININCEDFFCDFLNILFDLNLVNLNELDMNFPAIDLGDEENEICYQITTTSEKSKISSTLNKFINKKLYNKYSTLNILILGKKKKYEVLNHNNKFNFDIHENVIDFRDLSKIISKCNINKIERIKEFLNQHIYTINNNVSNESYLSNIKKEEIKFGKNYKSLVVDYFNFNPENEKEMIDTTIRDLIYFVNKLKELDINCREIIKAIIERRFKTDRRGKEYDKIYFDRDDLKSYLNFYYTEVDTKLKILYKRNFIIPIEDSDEEYDILNFMSEDKQWDILLPLVKFCEKYNRNIDSLILDLDLTILD